ncbi:chloroplast stem-loop binding protein of 41 kDa b, chloroplastic [Senna tora]|uniref:Chloroplast stem-loop binding protein of 41 kDa b, chloroplastic n=1 Tax=Senna tora TaxID=362788 RepID=A0A834THK1_9FABA|nr:chloroplast stem-loop binding protein of 41 kDa b, chloroplastic [Senna tora]
MLIQVFLFGSVPLKTYVPDGDIDLTTLCLENEEEDLAQLVCNILGNGVNSEYEVKDIQYIRAQEDAVDPKSRHKGKLETESLLEAKGVNWTSIRPVYIYGPLNYNPVEEWFFHRLKAGRPIPITNSGVQITQLGHVKDLEKAFIAVLGNDKASREVFNISGSKYVTFDGLARACAKAGGFPAPEIIHYNPKEDTFSAPARVSKTVAQEFPVKHLNILDPLRSNNNLGRSVSRGTES